MESPNINIAEAELFIALSTLARFRAMALDAKMKTKRDRRGKRKLQKQVKE